MVTLVGLLATPSLTKPLSALLYDVAPGDPVVMSIVAVITLLVACAATVVPARQAARTPSSGMCSRRVPWCFVTEVTCTGHVHLNALVDTGLTRATIRAAWRPRRAKVELFDPGRGWRYYITKEIGSYCLDWDTDRRARKRVLESTPRRVVRECRCSIGSQSLSRRLGLHESLDQLGTRTDDPPVDPCGWCPSNASAST